MTALVILRHLQSTRGKKATNQPKIANTGKLQDDMSFSSVCLGLVSHIQFERLDNLLRCVAVR